ncbi:MAG: hypothetical protein LBI13_02635 [Streptococcaceae bacterium]|jgi:hypothetical protein|nr:hypothetical protein [Streptococcaceae bacterium]
MKNIHDSEILNFSLNLKEKKLELKLLSDTNEEFIVEFLDVFSYSFDEPNSYTILYDITQMAEKKDLLIASKKELIDARKHLVESSWFGTAEDYNDFLIKNDYQGYLIYSSIGMHGLVIAKEMKVI